jgi:hypothetical protein
MEHMLLNLLNHALMHSPADAEITLDFHADGAVGELFVDSRLASSPDGEELDELLGGLQREPGAAASAAVDSLALAKFCADCQGHGLHGCIADDNRLQLRISNIRIN